MMPGIVSRQCARQVPHTLYNLASFPRVIYVWFRKHWSSLLRNPFSKDTHILCVSSGQLGSLSLHQHFQTSIWFFSLKIHASLCLCLCVSCISCWHFKVRHQYLELDVEPCTELRWSLFEHFTPGKAGLYLVPPVPELPPQCFSMVSVPAGSTTKPSYWFILPNHHRPDVQNLSTCRTAMMLGLAQHADYQL